MFLDCKCVSIVASSICLTFKVSQTCKGRKLSFEVSAGSILLLFPYVPSHGKHLIKSLAFLHQYIAPHIEGTIFIYEM